MFALLLSPLLQTFAKTCKPTFLGLEPWYQYLPQNADCSIKSFNALGHGQSSSILLIGLAILDDLVRIAALVAVGYVVYGGIQYVTSQGSPDATNRARQTIINALIGVVLAIIAASLVAFIGNKLAGEQRTVMILSTIIFAQQLLDKSQIHGVPTPNADNGTISTVMSVVFAITGSVALLIITISGFRYILSRGDSNAVAQAKDTIIYALVGLIISILAFSIVTFVAKGIG